jgi:hypothetical protein
MQGVRDYIKYIKRGFTRPTHLASIDIRHDRMDRDKGIEMLNEYEGKRPPSLDLFLDFIGLTEEEFIDVAKSHIVSPHEHHQDQIEPGKKTKDFDAWSRDGKMPRDQALKQMNEWAARKMGE